MIRQRILVVGCPRSGTTLVQSLLAAHPAVTSFTESHLFSDHFRALGCWPWALQLRDVAPRIAEFRRENQRGEEAPNVTTTTGVTRPGSERRLALPAAAARQAVDALDCLAGERGAEIWLEKTPRHLHHLDWLERLFGGAEEPRLDYVHVVRRGPATVRSLERASRQWSHPYSTRQCVERWNADLTLTLKRLHKCAVRRNAPSRDHVVFFEELVAQPQRVLDQLCDDLGLEHRDDLTDRVAVAAADLVLPAESWKEGVDRPLGGSRVRSADGLNGTVPEGLRSLLYERVREATA